MKLDKFWKHQKLPTLLNWPKLKSDQSTYIKVINVRT